MATKDKKKLENTKMLEAIEKVGNNPLEEAELYSLLINKDIRNISKIVNLVLKRADKKDDAKKYDLNECAIFIEAIRDKVLGFTDETGNIKTTPALKDIKYPNLYQAEEFVALVVDKSDKVDETFKLLEDISGIKLKTLTDWERELLLQTIFTFCEDPIKTSLGLN